MSTDISIDYNTLPDDLRARIKEHLDLSIEEKQRNIAAQKALADEFTNAQAYRKWSGEWSESDDYWHKIFAAHALQGVLSGSSDMQEDSAVAVAVDVARRLLATLKQP